MSLRRLSSTLGSRLITLTPAILGKPSRAAAFPSHTGFSSLAGGGGVRNFTVFGMAMTPVGHSLVLSGLVVAGLNAAGFLFTATTRSHKVTDLTGTGAFVASVWATHAVACRAAGLSLLAPSKSLLLTGAVTLWGIRLGGYLFSRVLQVGEDKRLRQFFPRSKDEPYLTGPSKYPLKLAGFWTIQGLWAWVLLVPVTVAQAVQPLAAVGPFGWLCFSGFVAGWAFETIADYQKTAFKSIPGNNDKFVNTGLYKFCRCPNYSGEILVWVSMYGLAGFPTIWAAKPWIAVSPLFICFLLLYVSGVPTIEAAHAKRYGKDPAYIEYKKATNVLLPWFPKKSDK